MPLFTVSEEICKRDGLCVRECPAGIIELKGDGSVPAPAEDAADRCISCGHCVAICPHGALSLTAMPSEACPTIDLALLPPPEAFDQMVRSRRSIRTYKDAPPAEDLIEALIKTASYAPTGTNSQQVGWTVILGQDKTEKLASLAADWMEALMGGSHPVTRSLDLSRIVSQFRSGRDTILRGAPALVVAHAPKGYPIGAMDCHIAMATLELAAFSNGLGACWAGLLLLAASSSDALREAMAIPTDRQPQAAMMLGYPRYAYQRIPLRKDPEITWP